MPEQCRNGHPYTQENTYIDPTGSKRCRECRRSVHYPKHKATGIRKQSSRRFYERHKERLISKSSEYYKENKPKTLARLRKAYLKYAYGITLEEFQAMLISQGNKCALCDDEFTGNLKPHMDHDHATGKNRELLCPKCNWGIGLFKEEPALFQKAIAYLEKHK